MQIKYEFNLKNYNKLPFNPISYWVSKEIIDLYDNNLFLGDVADPRQGLATGNDEEFLRFWYEINNNFFCVNAHDIAEFWGMGGEYAPFNKGGGYRKWFGNNTYIIRFNKFNYEKLGKQGNRLPSKQYYFKPGITWNALTSNDLSCRLCDCGYVFAGKGPMCFTFEKMNSYYVCGLLNSKISTYIMHIFSMTMDYNQGTMRMIPYIEGNKKKCEDIVNDNVLNCKMDWDSFEISWGFKKHPLI